MKILSAQKMREADAFTIQHEKIKSVDLMERAGLQCYNWLYEHAPKLFAASISEEKDWEFHIVCGIGNNGGDGLVIARYLLKNGYNVKISLVYFKNDLTKELATNLEKLGKAKKIVTHIRDENDLPDFSSESLIVDALFGTGLNRPADGLAAQVIERINASGARVVSIDVPSGLSDEVQGGQPGTSIVQSQDILALQLPKLCFFLSENQTYVRDIHILDIGLSQTFIAKAETIHHLLTAAEAAAMRQKRGRYTHKGTYGHALIIAGAPGTWGAAILCAKACLRSGAGLVSAQVGGEGASALLNSMPEIMIPRHEASLHFAQVIDLKPYNVIAVGPGLGKNEETARALKLLIQESKVPLVIDADALNIISENRTWLAFLPKGSILTPHPGEFARLIDEKTGHRDSMNKQRDMSMKYGIYILLKGAHSSLSLPDGRIIVNTTGNPGMASGGMGDSLCGIICGLLASGYGSLEAAALGMFVHGRSGDLSLSTQSVESLVASDLINNLGRAFQSLDDEV